jgi:hypothetical protein
MPIKDEKFWRVFTTPDPFITGGVKLEPFVSKFLRLNFIFFGWGKNSRTDRVLVLWGPGQGCQMACFQTKNTNLGKFRRALEWKKVGTFYDQLECNTAIWYFYGHLVI